MCWRKLDRVEEVEQAQMLAAGALLVADNVGSVIWRVTASGD
jgi:glucose/arabinose dehydrogenase